MNYLVLSFITSLYRCNIAFERQFVESPEFPKRNPYMKVLKFLALLSFDKVESVRTTQPLDTNNSVTFDS